MRATAPDDEKGSVVAIRIADDATIADVVATLEEPEPYVRGVLENLYECKREWGAATVRIGITGEGKIPHGWRVSLARVRNSGSICKRCTT